MKKLVFHMLMLKETTRNTRMLLMLIELATGHFSLLHNLLFFV